MIQTNWLQFSKIYCDKQDYTPEQLLATLQEQRDNYTPDGWMILECQVLDSSRLGHLVILPYGGKATLPTIPTGPISPRGLASDMSVVTHVMLASELPIKMVTSCRPPLTSGDQ